MFKTLTKAETPQQSVLDLATLTEDACSPENRFIAAVKSGKNVFLSGRAGTGKSTLLKRFIDEADHDVDVTAPTGIAALNVDGMTVHRWCGMLLGPQEGQSNAKYFTTLENDPRWSIRNGFRRVTNCQTLVIDEISMLPGRQLNYLDYHMRRIRYSDQPFGGVQLVLIGDFMQLPPVRTDEAKAYDWAFTSPAWKAADTLNLLLEKVHRQHEPDFVNALSDFRIGRIMGRSAKVLQERVKSFPPAAMTRLFTHNTQVDRWNDFQLEELPGKPRTYVAKTDGHLTHVDFLAKNLLTPSNLVLKENAVVMFTVNRPKENFVNGQTGVVRRLDTDTIWVETKHAGLIAVTPFTWTYGPKGENEATFVQFPLRLAYAMTIHKSQGLTLDTAYIDIRAAREPGQAYVAISRVRTLNGLLLKEWPKGMFVSSEAIKFYEGL